MAISDRDATTIADAVHRKFQEGGCPNGVTDTDAAWMRSTRQTVATVTSTAIKTAVGVVIAAVLVSLAYGIRHRLLPELSEQSRTPDNKTLQKTTVRD